MQVATAGIYRRTAADRIRIGERRRNPQFDRSDPVRLLPEFGAGAHAAHEAATCGSCATCGTWGAGEVRRSGLADNPVWDDPSDFDRRAAPAAPMLCTRPRCVTRAKHAKHGRRGLDRPDRTDRRCPCLPRNPGALLVATMATMARMGDHPRKADRAAGRSRARGRRVSSTSRTRCQSASRLRCAYGPDAQASESLAGNVHALAGASGRYRADGAIVRDPIVRRSNRSGRRRSPTRPATRVGACRPAVAAARVPYGGARCPVSQAGSGRVIGVQPDVLGRQVAGPEPGRGLARAEREPQVNLAPAPNRFRQRWPRRTTRAIRGGRQPPG